MWEERKWHILRFFSLKKINNFYKNKKYLRNPYINKIG